MPKAIVQAIAAAIVKSPSSESEPDLSVSREGSERPLRGHEIRRPVRVGADPLQIRDPGDHEQVRVDPDQKRVCHEEQRHPWLQVEAVLAPVRGERSSRRDVG